MTQKKSPTQSISFPEIFKALGELSLVINREGNYRIIHMVCQELLVRPSVEGSDQNIAGLFPHPVACQLKEAIAATLATGHQSRLEYHLGVDTEIQWFEARLTAISDDEVLFLAFDITAHKETQKRLVNAQANLMFILDSTEQSFFLIHKDSRLILMNRSAEGLLKRFGMKCRKPGEKMLRMMLRDWFSEIALAFNRAVSGTNSNFPKEIAFNGELYYFDVEVVPIRGSDDEPNIIAIGVKEITEQWNSARQLRESEARFRFLTQNVADVIWQMTPSGDFSFVSEGVERFIEHRSGEMIGQSVFRFVTSESAAQVQLALQALKSADGEKEGRFDLQFLCKNGRKNWGEVRYNGVYDRHHQLTDILGVVRDITGRRETELKLKETSARLLELNRTKDKFFSLIAHDLKNPMCAISGFSQLLEEDFDVMTPDEMKQCVVNINRSATDLNKLLDDLLVWSRTQTGTISFRPEMIEVGLLVNNVVLHSQLSANKKQIRIIHEVPYDLTVYADLNMVKTVLRNLLTNAIKFSFRGEQVLVSATIDGDFVTICVADKGIGMTVQVVENLLQSGTQVHNRGTEGESGSGFGLLISKEFIEYHGGTLWIKSTPGEGTAIFFTLPVDTRAANKNR